MRLAILHPEVAFRDCTDCEMHVYDEKTGERLKLANGQPMARPRGTCAPCRFRDNGCPKGTPEMSKGLSDRNWKAWQHYRECRAVGQFPDDAIVRRNAAIIRAATEAAEETLRRRDLGPLAALLAGGR